MNSALWRTARFALGAVIATVGLLVLAASDRGLLILAGGAGFLAGALITAGADVDRITSRAGALLDRPRGAA